MSSSFKTQVIKCNDHHTTMNVLYKGDVLTTCGTLTVPNEVVDGLISLLRGDLQVSQSAHTVRGSMTGVAIENLR
jgi:hypothetical protein